MTVQAITERIAFPFCANTMIGRGFSSATARYDLAQRFLASKKEALLLLVISDHDPAGEMIAQTLVSSLHDEFDIDAPIRPYRVALTREQVDLFGLLPAGTAKNSSHTPAFIEKFGPQVYELEALEPAELEGLIRDTLVNVIDPELFEYERKREEEDLATLYAKRQFAVKQLGGILG